MKLDYPLSGESFKSTSAFGERWGRNHAGVDLKADSGTRIVAVAPGEIVKSDDNDTNGYGGQILIKHNIDGKIFYSKYGHLRKRYVKVGESVGQGKKIGESGGADTDQNRGKSTGPHLHFEWLDGGKTPLDPEPYLKGVIALGTAAVVTSALSGNGEKDKDNTGETSKSGNVVNDLMAGFMKGYAPIAALASLKGLSTPVKETKLPQELMEEINRFKKLIK